MLEILIVESNKYLGEGLKIYLPRHDGFAVELVDDLTSALEKLRLKRYDAILLGLNDAESIKKVVARTNTCIVALAPDPETSSEFNQMDLCKVMFKGAPMPDIATALMECIATNSQLATWKLPVIKPRFTPMNWFAGGIASLLLAVFLIMFGVDLWQQLPTGHYSPNPFIIMILAPACTVAVHYFLKRE